MIVRHFTLVYLLYHFEREKKTRVLYGLKKSKYCAGTWVGMGGKVEQGETLLEGALREISEEAPGVEVIPESLVMRALLEIKEDDEIRFVHTMSAYTKGHLIPPFGSSAFHHFGWWDRALLPTPIPTDDIHWLPRALNLKTPPMSVKITGGDIAIAPDLRLAVPGYLQQKL